MSQPLDPKTEARVARIKSELDKLRGEWDRLDNMGSQSDRQNYYAREIDKLVEEHKKLTGEGY
jgi:hypothetical protein